MFCYYEPNGSISRISLSSKKASTFNDGLKPGGHTLQEKLLFCLGATGGTLTMKNVPQLTVKGLTPRCWTVTKDPTRMYILP